MYLKIVIHESISNLHTVTMGAEVQYCCFCHQFGAPVAGALVFVTRKAYVFLVVVGLRQSR